MNKSIKKTSASNIARAKQVYALGRPVESWLDVPQNIWVCWKDERGCFLGANDLVAEKSCLLNRQEIVGNSDSTLFPQQFVCGYRRADMQVLNGGCAKQFLEFAICKSGDVMQLLSTKTPLLDVDNNVRGVFVMSTCLTEERLPRFKNLRDENNCVANLKDQMCDLNNNLPKRIVLKGITLTVRESACVFYLAKGFSSKQIAKRLLIGERTVETLLGNAKNRLGYRYKTELVEELFNSGVL